MKHLQKFEPYSITTNEAFRHKFKDFMSDLKTFILCPIFIPIANLVNPRTILTLAETNLNIYHSLPTLRQALQSLLNNHSNDLTDTEIEDIEYKITKINKTLQKYPTLDSYKLSAKKAMKIVNFRNSNFLCNRIDTYQPIIIDMYKAVEEINKINKNIISNDSLYDQGTTRSTVRNIFTQARNQELDNPQTNPRDVNWTNEFDR